MLAAERVARAEYLAFRLCDEEYAIDILDVREIRAHEPVTRIAQAPAFLKGVINLRGAIVPIVDLRSRFGLPAAEREAGTVVVILALGTGYVGVAVDAVVDVVALARDDVHPAPSFEAGIDTSFIRGIAPLDGRMLIVADLAGLLESAVPAAKAA
ncbi:MAG TPA: chemotaxis protein CheW [Usitatibacter sp.]|nr:chemotaxis protein CheW [Usitatibacter sp.]